MQKLIAIAVCFVATSTFADIVQPIGSSTANLYTQAVQSFTATASEPQAATVSFMWGEVLIPAAPDPLMYVQLRSGSGFTGAILAQKQLPAIPDSTPPYTWIDFTFDAPVPLTAGQTYTLSFTANNTAAVSGSYVYATNDPYAGGSRYAFSNTPTPQDDLAFRVLAAPEPSSVGLWVTAAIALAIYTARR